MVRIYAIILNSDRVIGKLLHEDLPIPCGAPGPWAHSWAQTPADRCNQTGPDANGPVVFLRKDGQKQPGATRCRSPSQNVKPAL